MSGEYLDSINTDLEKLGFSGLPERLSYFKFEVDAQNGHGLAEVTVRYYPSIKLLPEFKEKKYRLVEIEEDTSREIYDQT